MRSSPLRRATGLPLLLLVLALSSACGESPSDPASGDADALEALLAEEPASPQDGVRPPFLRRLLGHAIHRVTEDAGADAAGRIRSRFERLQLAIREAREAGDEEAYRAAVLAWETEASRVVIRVLGPTVVRRVLHHASERLSAVRERVAARAAEGQDVTRARAILHRAGQLLREARAALEAGDLPASLRLGARSLDALAHID